MIPVAVLVLIPPAFLSGLLSGSGGSSGTGSVAEAAASYAAAHPTGYLDGRTLDAYLNQQGYTTAERSAFKQYLESVGWTYSGRR